jgi:ribosome-binding protein aMBF1 (putative translation factor)
MALTSGFGTARSQAHRRCRRGSVRRRCHKGTVSLPFYRWRLVAARPVSGYPENLSHIGDHIRKTRLDRGMNRKTAAKELRIDPISLKNWEEARTEVEVRLYPQILMWLGYDPMPQPKSVGEQMRNARLARGWSRKRLATAADIDEGTVKRLEADTRNMARRSRDRVLRVLSLVG